MKPLWYERPWFGKAVTIAFFVLLLVKIVQSVFFKENDFEWHWEIGRRVLAGQMPWGLHYPPGRVLFDELTALMPHRVARGLFFSIAVGSLLLTYRIWRGLAQATKPARGGVDFCAGALAFILLAPWAVRDFDECGLQILLLFFLSMAAWTLYRGARIQCGAWIGAAVTYKFTPILFIPLLIWKRRFFEAAVAIGFIVVFNAFAPAFVWGPGITQEMLTRYAQRLHEFASIQDPSENGVEPPTHRSQNLKLAIARFLQTYPPGHALFIDKNYADGSCSDRGVPPEDCRPHPMFVQFLDLPASTANRIVTAVICIIGLGMAWCMRHRWRLAQNDPGNRTRSSLGPEWAVACAFTPMLSPLAWQQHLVLVLPCAYLVIRDLLLRERTSRLRLALIAVVFVCVWILQRDPLPLLYGLIFMSYHEDVMAIFLLIGLTLTVEGARPARQLEPEAPRATKGTLPDHRD